MPTDPVTAAHNAAIEAAAERVERMMRWASEKHSAAQRMGLDAADRRYWQRVVALDNAEHAILALRRPDPSAATVEASAGEREALRAEALDYIQNHRPSQHAPVVLRLLSDLAAAEARAREAERMREALVATRAILHRYRVETPLGHQPHMAAGEADEALAIARAALGTTTPEAGA